MAERIETAINGKVRELCFPDGTRVPADAAGIERARHQMPSLRPVLVGLQPSFGFGDRLGFATAGHVAALRQSGGGIMPIFAQQSMLEMTRANRSPRQVIDDMAFGLIEAGYGGPTGADADLIKTEDEINRAAAAGFVMFTIDPTSEVDARADDFWADQLELQYKKIAALAPWVNQYANKKVTLPTGTVLDLNKQVCTRLAVKLGKAINRAIALATHVAKTATALGQPFEIELSFDGTPKPTSLAEHYVIVDQFLKAGLKLVSFAPRFVVDFEKGIDYTGELKPFERSLVDHASIAKALGPYKLSLHSGSEKLSIYPALARITGGLFHIKTSGSSYVEAVRVVAKHDVKLYREIIDFSRGRYNADKATFRVSATLADVAAPTHVNDPVTLERLYLSRWIDARLGRGLSDPGRQIIHCAFGSMLNDPKLGAAFRDVLAAHREEYHALIADHFSRHLSVLKTGMMK